MAWSPVPDDRRSPDQIREHYEIEKALADRLRHASKAERRALYTSVYDELYRRVTHHPQHTQKSSEERTRVEVARQLALLRPFLREGTTFLEIGPGDCALSFAVAARVARVYAADVSDEITRRDGEPENFQLLATDGSSIGLPPGTVDVAYSNQLLEHLHPEDALEHLRNVHAVLARGGRYVLSTPNRMSGPWDVSGYFDAVATGFHLKEYAVGELVDILRATGFSEVSAYVGARGLYMHCPVGLIRAVESTLSALPAALARRLGHVLPIRLLLGMRLVAVKS